MNHNIGMNSGIRFFLLILILAACTAPKKNTVNETATSHVTEKDILKGGTSFENPIILKVRTEKAGIREEFRWLTQTYPGYALVRKSRTSKNGRHFDIITFKTRRGEERIAYFDISSFFGK